MTEPSIDIDPILRRRLRNLKDTDERLRDTQIIEAVPYANAEILRDMKAAVEKLAETVDLLIENQDGRDFT
jgi:hypothetical protein